MAIRQSGIKLLMIEILIILSFIFSIFPPHLYQVLFNNLSVNHSKLNTSQDFGIETFIVGTPYDPSDFDPVHSGDSSSFDVIFQVAEGLFMHDFSDTNLSIVPRLAADYGFWDSTRRYYTVPLRQGVIFHDGTKFNASTVKWNFERINWFLNATGDLNTTLTQNQPLWSLPNGSLLLKKVNPITINNEYNITINLNGPFTIFESLLCDVSSYMLSPASTPKYSVINTSSGKLVGTGPFVYDSYIQNTEVRLQKWKHYWREPAFLDYIIFVIINDGFTRDNAMLTQDIDYLIHAGESMLPIFRNDPDIIVEENEIIALNYYYICMNNKKINRTWRKAISHAINYSFIIDEIFDGDVFRSNGPLAPSFPGYNTSIKAAIWDLAKARKILKDANVLGTSGLIVSNDTTGPIAEAWKAADLATLNYSFPISSSPWPLIYSLLLEDLDQIGIKVLENAISSVEFIQRAYGDMESEGFDSLELFTIGWSPYFLDPFTMFSTLYSNKSEHYSLHQYNSAQYYNHQVEQWLEEVLQEPDRIERDKIYSKILHQIVEADMPHIFTFHPKIISVYSTRVEGFYQNALDQLYCYTIKLPVNSGSLFPIIPGYSFIYILIGPLIIIIYTFLEKKRSKNKFQITHNLCIK